MSDLARVSLEAVVVAVTDGRPLVLALPGDGVAVLPSGALDADHDPTLERALRRVVDEQTGLALGYVEQLYTFGDHDRDETGSGHGPRRLGVAYLVLAHQAPTSAEWIDYYELFPWEDRRDHEDLDPALARALTAWCGGDPDRRQRVQIAFGLEGTPWDGVRSLDRYELLYEAGLVAEWSTDRDLAIPETLSTGRPMGRDHRRVAATALSRIRGKLTYRPVVFELLPETFTLSQLQHTVEALAGQRLHTQNFRRMVERAGLVEGTDRQTTTGGRPAELFRFRKSVLTERPAIGVS